MNCMSKITNYEWLLANVQYDSDNCLIWPFCRDSSNGYGRLGHKGKRLWAHRTMCTLANGEPPTTSHEAAHSCGRGHEGCIHPKHLSWKTPEQNAQDRNGHGTAKRHPRKLTREQAEEIRAMLGTMKRVDIAARYGVSADTVYSISQGDMHRPGPARHGRKIPTLDRPKFIRRANEMRAAGATFKQIGKDLGVSRLTARTLSRLSQ